MSDILISFNPPPAVETDKPLYNSELGTPIYQDITFVGNTYTLNDGTSVTFESVTIQNVLIQLSRTTNIVTTAIQGANGTVKEHINKGDYQVTMSIGLFGKNGKYPLKQVESLQAVIDAPIEIEVICKYLNDRNIYYLVFSQEGWQQSAGSRSQQLFSITAISDEPQQLFIQ